MYISKMTMFLILYSLSALFFWIIIFGFVLNYKTYPDEIFVSLSLVDNKGYEGTTSDNSEKNKIFFPEKKGILERSSSFLLEKDDERYKIITNINTVDIFVDVRGIYLYSWEREHRPVKLFEKDLFLFFDGERLKFDENEQGAFFSVKVEDQNEINKKIDVYYGKKYIDSIKFSIKKVNDQEFEVIKENYRN